MVNVFKLLPLGDWLWLGLAGALVGYHVVTLERAKIETRAAVNQEWVAKVDKANAEAKADHDAQQAKIDELAKSSQPEIARKFDSLKTQIAGLEAQAKKPPVVYAADCKTPPAQVEAYNAIR